MKDENLFIENFLRLTKNNYQHLDKENLEIIIINENIDIITKFMELYPNNINLLEMILNEFENIDEDILSDSDEDLTDTINITKIMNYSLKNDKNKVNEILKKENHLLDDEDVKNCIEFNTIFNI